MHIGDCIDFQLCHTPVVKPDLEIVPIGPVHYIPLPKTPGVPSWVCYLLDDYPL